MNIKNYKKYIAEIKTDERYSKLKFEITNSIYYVYRVTDLISNTYYYGSRMKKEENIFEDFWSYCTSSKRTKEIKRNKDNFKVKIIKIFDNYSDMIIYESFLHQYFDVRKNEKFWSKNNQNPFGAGEIRKGRTVAKNKHGETFDISVEDLLKRDDLVNCNKNTVTVNYKDNMLSSFFNVTIEEFNLNRGVYITPCQQPRSEEKRKKISENTSKAAKNRDIINCPHCGKQGQAQNMGRWHFDNCKMKKGNENMIRISPVKGLKFGKLKEKREYDKVECIYCGVVGGKQNMARYHFNNCKLKV